MPPADATLDSNQGSAPRHYFSPTCLCRQEYMDQDRFVLIRMSHTIPQPKRLQEIDFHDFHIIGGDDKDLDFWKSRNKQKNVIFHGYKINSEISELLIQFDILIAPYQYKVFINNGLNTASWMSPLKIFEYMSAGKPIVSSKLNVLKEVLTHNYNALLVKPDDVEEYDVVELEWPASPAAAPSIAANAIPCQNWFLPTFFMYFSCDKTS